jgi:H+/Cl- antiporter ClcA
MNWKNVLYLLRIERKSGRLIRGIKTTRYRENTFLAYWPYWIALIIGVVGGLIANFIVSSVYIGDAITNLPSLKVGALSVFVILPTIVLVFSFVFTLLQQIQLAGIKATGQVMYWLPITWQEQTLASILSN